MRICILFLVGVSLLRAIYVPYNGPYYANNSVFPRYGDF